MDGPASTPPLPKRRLGRFIVGHATFAADWRALRPLFARVVPVRAESLYHLDGIEYLALCDEFEEIDIKDEPPLYDVTYREVDGVETFSFHRAPCSEKQEPTEKTEGRQNSSVSSVSSRANPEP